MEAGVCAGGGDSAEQLPRAGREQVAKAQPWLASAAGTVRRQGLAQGEAGDRAPLGNEGDLV